MMKAIWLNDIHLEFLDESALHGFLETLVEARTDAVLIAGDIGQAFSVAGFLRRMHDYLGLPIYFVLGNHDYYHGTIASVREAIQALTTECPGLHWLNTSGVVSLTPEVALVGHDGWADGRLGDYGGSRVELNDFNLIAELTRLSKIDRLKRIAALGDEAAAHFQALLPEALDAASHVVVLTHVPPFMEAAWHNGHHCDAHFLPFFACCAVGDVLTAAMQQHPEKHMTVLCGHTHGGGISKILPNLTVSTGIAEYGKPIIQKVFIWA